MVANSNPGNDMINSCPVCAEPTCTPVLTLTDLPLVANATVTPHDGPHVLTGDVDLVMCHACAHLYNKAFETERLVYDNAYQNTLHYSALFRDHASTLADRLVVDFDLVGATVAEIGCGPGHLLSMLIERGVERALGFDPSFDPDRFEAPTDHRLTIQQELFPTDGSIRPDLVIMQHVVEHLDRPVEVLSQIRDAIAPGGGTYIEVPNATCMLDNVALWDLIYEHVSYFTPVSLARACAEAGLAATEPVTSFSHQFLSVDAGATPMGAQATSSATIERWIARALSFGEAAEKAIDSARNDLADAASDGKVALWGAGSKGTTYLNVVDRDHRISSVIDINPRKTGTGVPGTGHAIMGPEHLTQVRPTTVLVANPVYLDEIQAQLADVGLTPDVRPLW